MGYARCVAETTRMIQLTHFVLASQPHQYSAYNTVTMQCFNWTHPFRNLYFQNHKNFLWYSTSLYHCMLYVDQKTLHIHKAIMEVWQWRARVLDYAPTVSQSMHWVFIISLDSTSIIVHGLVSYVWMSTNFMGRISLRNKHLREQEFANC